jgi:hypothetical protein
MLTWSRWVAVSSIAALVLLVVSQPAAADTAVKLGGAYALLNAPAGAKASVILIPGGDGVMGVRPDGSFDSLKGNQLVRTRKAYNGHAIATLTIDQGVPLPAAIAHMRTVASPVVVVATSRGSLRVPGALAGKPDAVVLTAAFLDEVRRQIGAAAKLPRTLVVHHRKDGCKHTPPAGVAPFKSWGGDMVTVEWFEGGDNEGDPCQAKGYHGFAGQDGKVVARIARFALQGQ